jgi:5-methylcytosine-specific restriction endonuclease McrA
MSTDQPSAYRRMLDRNRARRAERRVEVLAKTDGCCFYCLAPLEGHWEIDHVVPRSRGGSNRFENLVPACADCNHDKGARTPEEWL